MRLIDANALIQEIREDSEAYYFNSGAERDNYFAKVDYAIDRVREAPTIEQPCMAVIPPEVIKTLSECVVDAISNIDWKTAIEKFSERKTGQWVESDEPNEKYVCSECGGACWYYDYEGEVAKSKFCPNCGAKMENVV